jgi:ribosomal protein L35
MKTHEAAAAVLRETKNPAVMWGDSGLLHLIADRAGLRKRSRGWETEDAVLRNLSRDHGDLVASYTTIIRGNRVVRIFYLPEHAPEWAKKQALARRPTKALDPHPEAGDARVEAPR